MRSTLPVKMAGDSTWIGDASVGAGSNGVWVLVSTQLNIASTRVCVGGGGVAIFRAKVTLGVLSKS